jgi:arylsulfatase A
MDVSSVLEGKASRRSKPLLWCYYNAINEHRVAMRHGNFKMLAKLDSGRLPKFSNVHAANRSVVEVAQLTDFELYDLSRDISEQHDIFSTAPEAQALKQLMMENYRDLVADSHVW